jgi:hypothetical protein
MNISSGKESPMTRQYWICLVLICAFTLMVAAPLLAEDEYPDPNVSEEVDPDGLEGIRVGNDHQAGLDEIETAGPNSQWVGVRLIRDYLRTVRAIGI